MAALAEKLARPDVRAQVVVEVQQPLLFWLEVKR